jgi:hypothetical protein
MVAMEEPTDVALAQPCAEIVEPIAREPKVRTLEKN